MSDRRFDALRSTRVTLAVVLLGSGLQLTAPAAAAMIPMKYSIGKCSIFGARKTTTTADTKKPVAPSSDFWKNRCLPNRLPTSAEVMSEMMSMANAFTAMIFGKIRTHTIAEKRIFVAPVRRFDFESDSCLLSNHPNQR